MDQQEIREHLTQAEKHVALGEQHLASQRAIVAQLDADGHDTTQARALLEQYEQLQVCTWRDATGCCTISKRPLGVCRSSRSDPLQPLKIARSTPGGVSIWPKGYKTLQPGSSCPISPRSGGDWPQSGRLEPAAKAC